MKLLKHIFLLLFFLGILKAPALDNPTSLEKSNSFISIEKEQRTQQSKETSWLGLLHLKEGENTFPRHIELKNFSTSRKDGIVLSKNHLSNNDDLDKNNRFGARPEKRRCSRDNDLLSNGNAWNNAGLVGKIETVSAWSIIQKNSFFRKNLDDIEIIQEYLKKYPGTSNELKNSFNSAGSVLEQRNLIAKWEGMICPPLKYPKGKVSNVDVSGIWKWEVKGTYSGEIEKIRKLKNDMVLNGFDIASPIMAIEYRGQVLLVNGHHRLAAAKAAGINNIPVKFLTDTEFIQEAKAMSQFSNKHSFYRLVKSKKDIPDMLPNELKPK